MPFIRAVSVDLRLMEFYSNCQKDLSAMSLCICKWRGKCLCWYVVVFSCKESLGKQQHMLFVHIQECLGV